MVLVTANRRKYVGRMSGRNGKYCRIPVKVGKNGQLGTGIMETLGKAGTKTVLSTLGKHTGSYGGKQLAKLIQNKTGSELLGKVAKSVLTNVGSFAGERLGSATGKLVSNTIFANNKKEKEKKVSVSALMDQARAKLMSLAPSAETTSPTGSGINLM